MTAVTVAVVVLIAVAAWAVVWPPEWAPTRWRRWTRPIRRRLRPRHYGHFH